LGRKKGKKTEKKALTQGSEKIMAKMWYNKCLKISDRE
jgi:hypothetical protein